MRDRLASLLLVALAAPMTAQAQPAPSPALKARIEAMIPLLSGAGNYADFFNAGFQASVPKARLDAIVAQLTAASGPIRAVERIDANGPYEATVRLRYRDAVATVQIAIEPGAPHRVSGLLFRGVVAAERTLADVTAALDQLHGNTGYLLARLGAGAPRTLVARSGDRPFAVGSAFKLVLLAELVRATNAGERKWTDTVSRGDAQLPGGAYYATPAGTRISLAELAEKMISVSDNSATDILLHALGRDRVEAMLPTLGVSDPRRNRPFLATMEAFKLKYLDGGGFARRYLALDDSGKRALLAGDIARTPLVAIPPELPGGRLPAMIDTIEWFFTPADLMRIMDWLRRNTEGEGGAPARAILAKNPGLPPSTAEQWQWVGYKGGSEPGLINLTFLLQAKGGDWYVLTGSWNDPARPVDESRFLQLIARAAELALL